MINTVSSIETEVISVDEKIPKDAWFRTFVLKNSGDPSQLHVLLYQDNKSVILLQNNGRLSCNKRSKYIHIKSFFITDRIDTGRDPGCIMSHC